MALTLSGSSGVLDNSGAFIAGTAVASTSGTSITFTSIPSWVKRVTINLNSVSTNSTTNYIVQIGAGSLVTTGYIGGLSRGTTATTNSTGFQVVSNNSAAQLYSGSVVLTTLGSNIWVESGNVISNGTDACSVSGGALTLSGALDRVSVTTVGNADTFDAGSINILYE
jgi:hypothetical protein